MAPQIIIEGTKISNITVVGFVISICFIYFCSYQNYRMGNKVAHPRKLKNIPDFNSFQIIGDCPRLFPRLFRLLHNRRFSRITRIKFRAGKDKKKFWVMTALVVCWGFEKCDAGF
jgi:hypothetical protein